MAAEFECFEQSECSYEAISGIYFLSLYQILSNPEGKRKFVTNFIAGTVAEIAANDLQCTETYEVVTLSYEKYCHYST